MLSFRRLLLAAALACALVAGRAPDGRALSLADLDAGASFATGGLLFSDFDVTLAGALTPDLSAYAIQVLADGFRIAGPISALLEGSGTLLVSYAVEAAEPLFVAGASLFASLVAVGPGAAALAADSLFVDGAPVGTLFAFAADGAPTVNGAAVGFAPASRVEVAKTVVVQAGLFAAAPLVEQRFFAVPEPMPMLLVGLGLLGLAVFGGRRTGVSD